jgi:hypothetical protein
MAFNIGKSAPASHFNSFAMRSAPSPPASYAALRELPSATYFSKNGTVARYENTDPEIMRH